MKTCPVVCTGLIKIKWITASKLSYSSWLPLASNFAKDQENIGRELCLNVIIPFCIIECNLQAYVMFQKNYFHYIEMGRQKQSLGRGKPPPLIATALPPPRKFLRDEILLKKLVRANAR